MKRLNPKTNKPFVRGDTREEDDHVFMQYGGIKQLDKFGNRTEWWTPKEQFKENVIKNSSRRKQYEKTNPNKHRARNSSNGKQRRKRKPKWIKDVFLKEIQEYYIMAIELEKVFPWKQHVDHVVPLVGKNVSGLHVPWNLQILSWRDNIKKGNKYADESDAPSLSEGYYKDGRVYTQHGTLPSTGPRENDYHLDYHRRTVSRENADHCTETSGRDSMGHRSTEMGPSEASESLEDTWQLHPTYGWIER